MLCLLLHTANGSTVFPLAVNIEQGGTLGYWWDHIYGQRGCYWFIEVAFMEDGNQFPEVLHC